MHDSIVPNTPIDRQSTMATGPLGPVLATALWAGNRDAWRVISADGEPLGMLIAPDESGVWEPVAPHEIRAAVDRLRELVQLAGLDVDDIVVVDEHTIRAYGPAPVGMPTGAAAPTDPQRAAVIAGLREMANWLEANPGIPVGPSAPHIQYGAGYGAGYGAKLADDEGRSEVDRLATAMGSVAAYTYRDSHYAASREFSGAVRYEVIHIARREMDDFAARDRLGREALAAQRAAAAGGESR